MSKPISPTEPEEPVCARCGQVHPDCTAHSVKRNGGPCGGKRMRGLRVCWSHGGAASQARKAGKRRVQAAELDKALTTYGRPREVNPVQAMVEILQLAIGHMDWLLDAIRAEEPQALVWGIADELTKGSGEFPGVDVRKAAAPSVLLQRYDVERRIALDASDKLARLGMDWETREVVRRQGAVLARVVRELVRLLGHDPNDPTVARAFTSALRAVLGAGVDVDRVLEGRLT